MSSAVYIQHQLEHADPTSAYNSYSLSVCVWTHFTLKLLFSCQLQFHLSDGFHIGCIRDIALCRRGEIELCARLLGIAAAGLNENPGLLGFVILAKIGLLTVMVPLLAFSGFAYTNGGLVANSRILCSSARSTAETATVLYAHCRLAAAASVTLTLLHCIVRTWCSVAIFCTLVEFADTILPPFGSF